jgi:fatty-acyl-CoA synthase
MGAAGVAMACAIGLPHPKWGERPMLLVAPKPGESPTAEAILAHLAGRCAKWQLPDAVMFVETLPVGPTGKLDKKFLKARYKDHFIDG